jgi:hypothetical protein
MTIEKWYSLVKDEELKKALFFCVEQGRLSSTCSSLGNAISSGFGWMGAPAGPPAGYHYDLPKTEVLPENLTNANRWRMVYYLAEKNKIPMHKVPSPSNLMSEIGDPIMRAALREIYRFVTKHRPALKRRHYDDLKELTRTLKGQIPEDNYEYHAILDVILKGNLSD